MQHKSPAFIPVCPRSVVSGPSVSPKTGLIENKYVSLALNPVTRYDLEAADNSSWERSEAVKKEETCIDREPEKLKIIPISVTSHLLMTPPLANRSLGTR